MNTPIRSSTYILTLRIIYYAQLASLLAFSVIVFFLLNNAATPVDKDLAATLQYPLSAFFIAGLAASQLIPRYILKKIDPAFSLKQKMTKYTATVIIRGACMEVPGLFACVVAMLTGQIYYLLVIPLLLIMFLLYLPSQAGIISDLNLTPTERAQVEDPNAVITEDNNEV